jgi:hypothetical protein
LISFSSCAAGFVPRHAPKYAISVMVEMALVTTFMTTPLFGKD